MDSKKYTVQLSISGRSYIYPKGTLLADIVRDFQKQYDHDILLCKVDGRVKELHHHLHHDAALEFITTASPVGHRTYKRSCAMLFMAALYEVAGLGNVRRVINHFSVDDGFYYTVDMAGSLDGEFTEKIEERMHEMADANLPIYKKSVGTEKAIGYFEKKGQLERASLFKTRLSSRVHLYELNGYEDYYYGCMVLNTGYLKYFKLSLYREGIILQMPSLEEPEKLKPAAVQEKLFNTQLEGERQSDILGIPDIGSLNECLISGDTREVILASEAMQETRLSELADDIAGRETVKFVMIAGPSSSGKTTFSQRLCIQLKSRGLKPHYVGLDNYYRDRSECPLNPDGSKDFECLEALDVAGFNRDMTALLKGKTVDMPHFDFVRGERVYRGDYLTLGKQDILIIEGIHGLNDKMSSSLPSSSKYRVYISALTQLNIDDHNRIPSSDVRLIRRIIRDNRTRGSNAAETLGMWPAVRRGEEKNIFPFEENTDFIFNSALPYELAVLKQYAQPLLFRVPAEDKSFPEAQRLLKFLDYFIGLPAEDVPSNSILREFIGNGCFHL